MVFDAQTAELRRPGNQPVHLPATLTVNVVRVWEPEPPPGPGPERAQVLLDGVQVSNPYHETRAADGKTHTITGEASGFLRKADTFVLNGDQFLTIHLEPRPQKVHHGPADAGRSVVTRSRNNCDPPYYYDERGIKRYRVECL